MVTNGEDCGCDHHYQIDEEFSVVLSRSQVVLIQSKRDSLCMDLTVRAAHFDCLNITMYDGGLPREHKSTLCGNQTVLRYGIAYGI